MFGVNYILMIVADIMRKKMLFSVIVPVYNIEKYLSECVDSILGQTCGDFELILVEDGSTDSSGKICDEYQLKDQRVTVIHKKNGGATSARKAGLRLVTGEYFCFVDADDYVQENFIQNYLNIIEQYHPDLISIGFLTISSDGRYIGSIDNNIDTGEYKGENLKKIQNLLFYKQCNAGMKRGFDTFHMGGEVPSKNGRDIKNFF